MILRGFIRSAGLGVLIGLTIVWLASLAIHIITLIVRPISAEYFKYFLLFVVGHIIGIALIHFSTLATMLLSARVRRVRVFISFQHAFEPLAQEVEAACAARGFVPLRIPFVEGRAHNDTVRDVDERLREADVLIAIPGPRQSAMDQEVAKASFVNRGIVFLKNNQEHRDVSLCYKGHPVFDIQAVRNGDFELMLRFVSLAMNRAGILAAGYGRGVMNGIGRGIQAFLVAYIVILPVLGVLGLICLATVIVLAIFDWQLLVSVYQRAAVLEEVFEKGAVAVAIAAVLPISLARTITAWNAASQIVYRGFQSGELTPDELISHIDEAVGLEEEVIAAMVGGKEALAGRSGRHASAKA